MRTTTIKRKKEFSLSMLFQELQIMRNQLARIFVDIPEESLDEYSNAGDIQKKYTRALKHK